MSDFFQLQELALLPRRRVSWLRWLHLPLVIFLLCSPGRLFAQEPVRQASALQDCEASPACAVAPHIRVSLRSDLPYLQPGVRQQFALVLEQEPGWHTYWVNPGDSGRATTLDWELPEGIRAGALKWPVPGRIAFGGGTIFGYHGETWLLADLAMPPEPQLIALAEAMPGQRMELAARASWLVCREVCVQGEARLSLALPLYEAEAVDAVPNPAGSGFDDARGKLPEQIPGAPARYRVDGEQLVVELDLDALPVLQRRPEVFVAAAGLALDARHPTIVALDEHLQISTAVNPALAESPSFLPLLLKTPEDAEKSAALRLLARYEPGPVSIESIESIQSIESIDTKAAANTAASADGAGLTLPYVLLLALLGGVILNAMPCVFPVLSLKVLSLVEHGNDSAALRRRHGLAYTSGVIGSFVLVAAVLIALRAAGEQIGWGFQLQAPGFVAALVYVLFLLGLSLSGMFEFGSALQNLGQGSIASSSPMRASFLTGVLATVVATPCTAPFMGTAMGFALTQPLAIALLTFAVLGLGLALPFLLVAFIPALANWLPAPGNWMVRLKELLAFPIYLTVVWLLWVFARQAGVDAMAALLIGLVMLALATWLRRSTLYGPRARAGALLALGSSLLAVLALFWALQLKQGGAAREQQAGDNPAAVAQAGTQAWSQPRLDRAIADGKTVFVNMTADWCITCKVNERVALSREEVKRALARPDVEYLVGDWTNSDPAISNYLERFERNGVPLYVVYRPGEAPKLLPQVLTPGTVLEALR